MKLEDVLALRPVAGDAATIRAAITKAGALRAEHAALVAELERARPGKLLTADEKAIMKADQEAAAARLVVERLDALMPLLLEDQAAAEGRETVALLRTEAEAAVRDIQALQAWQDTELPKVWEIITRGFALEDTAVAANTRLIANVKAAYERQEVRDAGPLNVEVPAIPAARPRATFHAWVRGS